MTKDFVNNRFMAELVGDLLRRAVDRSVRAPAGKESTTEELAAVEELLDRSERSRGAKP